MNYSIHIFGEKRTTTKLYFNHRTRSHCLCAKRHFNFWRSYTVPSWPLAFNPPIQILLKVRAGNNFIRFVQIQGGGKLEATDIRKWGVNRAYRNMLQGKRRIRGKVRAENVYSACIKYTQYITPLRKQLNCFWLGIYFSASSSMLLHSVEWCY